jgi:catechol 2,3-dioxygenase-like lactoylglutathione lyase family enzyme
MKVDRIDHVQLAMPSGHEDEARSFYSGLLGISETPKPAHLAARGGCWFEQGDLKIHLRVEADFRAARKPHPALLVDGLQSLVEVLRAAGVEIRDDEPLEGYDRVYVDDPFGNRIELMEPVTELSSAPPAG